MNGGNNISPELESAATCDDLSGAFRLCMTKNMALHLETIFEKITRNFVERALVANESDTREMRDRTKKAIEQE